MFKAISLLLSSTILSSFFTFLAQLITARNLSPNDFGILISSLTLVVLVSPILAMGLDGYLLKHYAQEKCIGRGLVKVSILYIIVTIFPSLVIFILIGSDIGTLFYFLVISQLFINLAIALRQVERNFKKVSFILSVQSLVRLSLLILLVLLAEVTLKKAYFVYVFSSVVVLLIMSFNIFDSLKILGNSSSASIDKKINLKFIFFNAYPFGVGVFLHLIYFQSAILLLGKLDSAESAGIYGVAFTILTLAYLIPGVVFQRYLLPKVHDLTEAKDIKKLMLIFSKGFKLMLLGGVVFSIFFYFISELIIILAFGNEYEDAVRVLQSLSICILFRYLSSSAGVFLVSGNLITKKNYYMSICAVFNVSLNFILIPIYGVSAAIFVTILSEVFLMLLFFRGAFKHKFFNYSPFQLIFRR